MHGVVGVIGPTHELLLLLHQVLELDFSFQWSQWLSEEECPVQFHYLLALVPIGRVLVQWYSPPANDHLGDILIQHRLQVPLSKPTDDVTAAMESCLEE